MQQTEPSQTYLYDIRTDKHKRRELMWDISIQGEEYFHVDVLTDKTEQGEELELEKSIDDILNLNKYKCYICNIEVPKTYTIEHNNSAKHRTCNKIANIALERTRHQMQLDNIVRRKIEVLDTYFCEPCATVVLNSDKESHERTKIHKISLKHDEVLSDMLKIYEDIGNIEVNSDIDVLELLKDRMYQESLQELDLQNSYIHSENAGFTNIVNAQANSQIDKLELLEYKMEQDSMQELKLQNTNMENKNVVDIKEIKELRNGFMNQFDSGLEESVKMESIETETTKNELYPVSVDKIEQCNENIGNLSVMVKNIKQKNVLKSMHIAKNKKHTNNSAVVDYHRSNKDIHGETDISIKHNEYRDSYENCKVSDNIEVYFEGDELNELKEENNNETNKELVTCLQSNTKDNASQENPNDGVFGKVANGIEAIISKYFDSSCTVDALNSNAIKQYNKNKGNKKDNLEQKNKDITKKKSHNTQLQYPNKDINEHNKQKQEIKETYNKTEQQTVNNEDNKTNIPVEEKKEQHKKVLEQKKDANKKNQEQDIKNQPKAAKPVKSKAPSFNLICYLKDISRRCEIKPTHTIEALTDTIVQITAVNGDKFKVLVNNFHSFHVKSNDIYCKVCETPNVKRPEWHIVENNHRTKVMTPIQDLNGIRQLDNNWSHCLLCNDLTTTVDFHLETLHHKNKVKQTLVELGQTQQNQKIHEKSNKKNTVTELMTKNNLTMTNKGYLNCIICDLIVDYDTSSINQHINSFHHLDKFELKLAENKVVNRNDDVYYCMPCDTQFAKMYVVTHCNGKKHGRLLQEFLSKQEEMTADEMIALTSISQNVKKLSKDKMEDSELICFVCNVIILSINEHTDTFNHKKSYLSYLESNKLNEIEPDTFYCIPCNTVIGIDYLMSHCMSKKHKHILKCFYRKTGHEIDYNDCTKQGLQGNTECNVCKKQRYQDNTDCNVCDEGHQDDTDCHKQSLQGNTECNVCNQQERQDNTECNVCNKQKHQDNTINKDCNKQGHQDNTDSNECNVCNKQDHQENRVPNICKIQEQESECNICNKQDKTEGIVCNTQDNTEVNVCSKGDGCNETKSQPSTSLAQSVGSNIAMPLKVLYQFQEIQSSNNLQCTICDEQVTYTRKLASYHVSTLDHVVAFNLMMLWNKIKKRDDRYFCDICLTDITYFSEICHVLGKEHTDNLAKQPKGTVYEYDSSLVTHAYAMSHKAGDRVRPSPVVSVKCIE